MTFCFFFFFLRHMTVEHCRDIFRFCNPLSCIFFWGGDCPHRGRNGQVRTTGFKFSCLFSFFFVSP